MRCRGAQATCRIKKLILGVGDHRTADDAHAPVDEGDLIAGAIFDVDGVVDVAALAGNFACFGGQPVIDRDRAQVVDGCGSGDCFFTGCVARKAEREVGEREQNTAVAILERVAELRANVHCKPAKARLRVNEFDAEVLINRAQLCHLRNDRGRIAGVGFGGCGFGQGAMALRVGSPVWRLVVIVAFEAGDKA